MPPGSRSIQSVSELQLLVSSQGSIPAFESLYLMFYKDLHKFATRIIRSEHIAEEIVSDIFVQLWKRRAHLSEIRDLRVFLFVSVKNLALTYLYKARKQKICWIEEFAEGARILEDPSRADHGILGKETASFLQKAVNNLPVKCRAIFHLVKEEGLKYSEAAKLLNLSVKTIENQMGIALKKIAQQLPSSVFSRRS
jgi:RNA polymerase sigma-70 factor (family 1)